MQFIPIFIYQEYLLPTNFNYYHYLEQGNNNLVIKRNKLVNRKRNTNTIVIILF